MSKSVIFYLAPSIYLPRYGDQYWSVYPEGSSRQLLVRAEIVEGGVSLALNTATPRKGEIVLNSASFDTYDATIH